MPGTSRPPIPPDLARAIRLVVLDVDGVMTDGGIHLGATESGERVEMKRFEVQDGLGVRLLQDAGIVVAIVTGRESGAVALRAEELGIVECHQDRTAAKLRIVEDLRARLQLEWSGIAFLGDDLPDLPLLRRVGLPAVVANASAEARACAAWESERPGGHGAVREFAEAILQGRGEWTRRVEAYVRQRERGDA